jgi:hypothetical protein
MNTRTKGILAVILGLSAILGPTGAIARDGHGGRHDGGGRYEQRWDGHRHGGYSKDHRHHHYKSYGYVRPAPRAYYYAPPVYYAPPAYYAYPRYYYGDPSVVINVPPFVFNFD